MRITTVLVSMVLLSGCQSEFDNCMEAELPRAESILAVGEKANAITTFKLASSKGLSLSEAEAKFQLEVASLPTPEGRPVYPKSPPYSCNSDMSSEVYLACLKDYKQKNDEHNVERQLYQEAMEEWKSTADVIAWNEAQDEIYIAAFREVGILVNSIDELELWLEEFESEFEIVRVALKERAADFDCWGEEEKFCYDPISEETESTFGVTYEDDGYYSKRVEVYKLAVAEILVEMTEEYAAAVNRASELAELTCNQNGIYE